MKIERINYYGTGSKRLFYITENKIFYSITAHVYTVGEGRKDVNFHHLEFELWSFDFNFKTRGKYAIVIFEDGLRSYILVVTIK